MDQSQPEKLPPLPQLWIGYALGIGTIIAEAVAVSLHPEMAKDSFPIPPLYLFLATFIGGVYWLTCVYRYHVILQHVPGWKHPITPGRAVGYHFIPLYNLYWVFKWPQEIARFVNWKFRRPVMKPQMVGLMVFAAVLMRVLLDPGFGLILLFVSCSYISASIGRALALPPPPTENTLPFS